MNDLLSNVRVGIDVFAVLFLVGGLAGVVYGARRRSGITAALGAFIAFGGVAVLFIMWLAGIAPG